ncbi:MAG: protein-L-isoaspartate(D-aspartate) O-methyltransferase [Gammaproteobacteria bacterium]|nr:protein-L-isoaspartate(D-aspartate) O-methyltransferase [Gammaproteobacteria bacterium]
MKRSFTIKEEALVRKRQLLLQEIEAEVGYTQHYLGKKTLSPRVMAAMEAVPRHEFVSDNMQSFAYCNEPLPIGHGQTISQPYIVAIMTDLIDPQADHKVLDVGTGSGYQAAVLSQLVDTVYSVEIIDALTHNAQTVFEKLAYHNIQLKTGDGSLGWPEHGPYDGIVVAAAAPMVPPALVEQLKPGGKLILPIGQAYHAQELVLIEKQHDGMIKTRNVLPVSFVPLITNFDISDVNKNNSNRDSFL